MLETQTVSKLFEMSVNPMEIVYALRYKPEFNEGRWVQRDDSTGPMSSGGYPFPVDNLNQATKFLNEDDARDYRGIVDRERMDVYKVALVAEKI